MSIQWYPGHMHKAQKEIRKVLSEVDLIIEVLDARIPYSSNNPSIENLRGDKPFIKILTKTDLADPEMTAVWQEYLEKSRNTKTLAVTSKNPSKVVSLLDLCRKMLPEKDQSVKTIRAMIMGIPNVGKSTLINTLAGRTIAKTGNEPAVTKNQQRINLDNGILLIDTPGMLWPKVENPDSGYRLAITGAIKDTAIEYEDIAFYLAGYLLKHYPEALKQRFHIDSLPESEIEFLDLAAARRGCVRAGGRADLHKISEILVHDLRSGQLGPITLENPTLVETEEIEVARVIAEKAEKKAQRKAKNKPQRGN